MYAGWPFFKALVDGTEISTGKADMGIARLYAGLVDVTGQRRILEHNPTLRQGIASRNPYVDPLNFIQVGLLRKLRALPDQESPEGEALLKTIFLTINGIAAGLKNTG